MKKKIFFEPEEISVAPVVAQRAAKYPGLISRNTTALRKKVDFDIMSVCTDKGLVIYYLLT
jgi:hypothetical protein